MYKISSISGELIGYAEKIKYIKINKRGVYVETTPGQATGIAYNSTPYNLMGYKDFIDAETVVVSQIEIDSFLREISQNTANIDYISMMTGIEL